MMASLWTQTTVMLTHTMLKQLKSLAKNRATNCSIFSTLPTKHISVTHFVSFCHDYILEHYTIRKVYVFIIRIRLEK